MSFQTSSHHILGLNAVSFYGYISLGRSYNLCICVIYFIAVLFRWHNLIHNYSIFFSHTCLYFSFDFIWFYLWKETGLLISVSFWPVVWTLIFCWTIFEHHIAIILLKYVYILAEQRRAWWWLQRTWWRRTRGNEATEAGGWSSNDYSN